MFSKEKEVLSRHHSDTEVAEKGVGKRPPFTLVSSFQGDKLQHQVGAGEETAHPCTRLRNGRGEIVQGIY